METYLHFLLTVVFILQEPIVQAKPQVLYRPIKKGCYQNDLFQPKPFDNSKHQYSRSKTSVTSCVNYCGAYGYAYAALEFGTECRCGNKELDNSKAGSCNTPCSGDKTQICGGSGQTSIYAVERVWYRFIGCVNFWNQDLFPQASFSYKATTSTKCQNFCNKKGAGYAGLTYFRGLKSCHCSKSILPRIQFKTTCKSFKKTYFYKIVIEEETITSSRTSTTTACFKLTTTLKANTPTLTPATMKHITSSAQVPVRSGNQTHGGRRTPDEVTMTSTDEFTTPAGSITDMLSTNISRDSSQLMSALGQQRITQSIGAGVGVASSCVVIIVAVLLLLWRRRRSLLDQTKPVNNHIRGVTNGGASFGPSNHIASTNQTSDHRDTPVSVSDTNCPTNQNRGLSQGIPQAVRGDGAYAAACKSNHANSRVGKQQPTATITSAVEAPNADTNFYINTSGSSGSPLYQNVGCLNTDPSTVDELVYSLAEPIEEDVVMEENELYAS